MLLPVLVYFAELPGLTSVAPVAAQNHRLLSRWHDSLDLPLSPLWSNHLLPWDPLIAWDWKVTLYPGHYPFYFCRAY